MTKCANSWQIISPKRIADLVKGSKRLAKRDYEEWQAILYAKGWLAPSWPLEFGGTNWSAVQKHIFDEECCIAGAPRVLPFGIGMLGPVLIKFGSDQQKAHYLPRILDGSDWWCQGYSEPGAGSDLASLKTKAERKGDHYVVNGQKNLDDPWPACRLDILPCQNLQRRQATGGYFIFADRHENARHRSSSNYFAGWRTRGERSIFHRCYSAGKKSCR